HLNCALVAAWSNDGGGGKKFYLPRAFMPGATLACSLESQSAMGICTGLIMKSRCIRLVCFVFTVGIALTTFIGCGSQGVGNPGHGSPTLTFSANSSSISSGQSVTLSWQTTNASSVTIT